MKGPARTIALYALAFIVAIVGGAFAMNALQKETPIIGGEKGCSRLESFADRQQCFSTVLYDELRDAVGDGNPVPKQKALDTAFTAIDDRAARHAPLGEACHVAMHSVGEKFGAAAARSTNGALVFPTDADRYCSAGYTHGIVQGWIDVKGADADLGALFGKLCREQSSAAGCAHGVGHALFRTEYAELNDGAAAAKRSVDACRQLPKAHLYNCANGVYMELGINDAAGESVAYFAQTCNDQQSTALQRACMFYLVSRANTDDISDAELIDACIDDAAPYTDTCIRSLGRSLSVDLIATCIDVPATFQEQCVDGALELPILAGSATPEEINTACAKRLTASARLSTYCLRTAERLRAAQSDR